jgi:regulator of replication initiation timing
MESNAQIAETLNKLVSEISALKTTLPSSDLRIIQLNMEEFKHAQSDMKKDLSDLKKKLLDPDDGVIVKVNENTKFRIEQEKLQEREEKEYKELILEHSELMKWKGGVTKAMWIFFTAIVGIVAKIFFMGDPS